MNEDSPSNEAKGRLFPAIRIDHRLIEVIEPSRPSQRSLIVHDVFAMTMDLA